MVVDEASLKALVEPHVGATGGLMIALLAVQAAHGHIPPESHAAIADAFNITKAEVRGVVSFYDDFTDAPVAKTVVRVCQAEACQSVGGRTLTEQVGRTLGLALGEANADNSVAFEPVYCLGLCSCAPAMMVGDKLVGRAEGKRVDAALAGLAKVKAS